MVATFSSPPRVGIQFFVRKKSQDLQERNLAGWRARDVVLCRRGDGGNGLVGFLRVLGAQTTDSRGPVVKILNKSQEVWILFLTLLLTCL